MRRHGNNWLKGALAAGAVLPQLARKMDKVRTDKAYYRWIEEGMKDDAVFLSVNDGREEGIYLSVVDSLPLAFTIMKAENPKGLVQIIHGAQEHRGYYLEFAENLAKAGYTVLLSDNRGHGDSVSEDHPRGYISSIDDLLLDQYTLTVYFKRRFPGLSLTLFGHSFGSLIARNYIMDHDDIIDKLILTGAVCYPPSAKLGLAAGNIERFFTNGKRRGALVTLMDSKTKAALNTISNNPEFLNSFKGDRKLVSHYLNGGAMAIWEAASRLKDYRRYKVKNPNLSVLALNGSEDPLTGGVEGLTDTAKTFYNLGYKDYENRVFSLMKHDLLHEEATEYVMKDIIGFLER